MFVKSLLCMLAGQTEDFMHRVMRLHREAHIQGKPANAACLDSKPICHLFKEPLIFFTTVI
jgi:hypothetical protein